MWLFRPFILILLLVPLSAGAQGINAGFVEGLWYGHDPFFADKEVRIYVALRNNADGDLTGTVQFLDNGELINERRVSALEGKVVDTWTDWTPSYGAHKVEALLTNVRLDGSTDIENATVTVALAADVRIVDYDTDGDGVGNEADSDDDGDGVSDEEEIQNGTNPLVFDEPEPDTNENIEGEDREDAESADETREDGSRVASSEEATEEPSGFETFVKDTGVAKDVLEGITSVSNSIKSTIDTHRDNRAARKAAQETPAQNESDEAREVDALGEETDWNSSSSIGEVTRTKDEETKKRIDFAGMFGSIFDKIYAALLFILSLYFAHPGIVQFTVLLLVLLALYHTMRRLARRPQD